MTWNAYIWIKATGKMSETAWAKVKEWAEVEQVWSTSGDWDWLIKLKPTVDSWEKAKQLVFSLREQPWIGETNTWWAKSV